jgi:hypothetical protein
MKKMPTCISYMISAQEMVGLLFWNNGNMETLPTAGNISVSTQDSEGVWLLPMSECRI